MRNIKRLLPPLALAGVASLLLTTCSTTPTISRNDVDDWFDAGFDRRYFLTGCAGLDCIRSIDKPGFIDISDARSSAGYNASDLVVGFTHKGQTFAVPVEVLDRHEVVNMTVGGDPVAVTYCPLTETAVVFRSSAVGGNNEFGVSGFLFYSNLVLYDRPTESIWSQMWMRGETGKHAGRDMDVIPMQEMTFSAWGRLHPGSRILAFPGGDPIYQRYPYESQTTNYWTDENLLRPGIAPPDRERDRRLSNKTRVLGVMTEYGNRAYSYRNFGVVSRVVKNDFLGTGGQGPALLVSANLDETPDADADFIFAYDRTLDDGTILRFDIDPESADDFPFLLIDRETGSKWNLNGEAIEGTLAGTTLKQFKSYNAFWFAWSLFWPGSTIGNRS